MMFADLRSVGGSIGRGLGLRLWLRLGRGRMWGEW
jgi:hypothetical protein